MPRLHHPTVLVFMGVSGSGKTTVATRVAELLAVPFEEGDSLHPPENVAKMRAGIPLEDADRWPWLRLVGDWIDARLADGGSGVVTCSALKRSYRDVLRRGPDQVRFVLLDGPREVIAGRLAERKGHYMPASLLESQIATLERPAADERPILVPLGAAPDQQAAAVLQALGL